MFAIRWAVAVAAHIIEGARFEPQEGRGFCYRQVRRAVSSDVIATHGFDYLRIQVEENGNIRSRQEGKLLVLRHDTPVDEKTSSNDAGYTVGVAVAGAYFSQVPRVNAIDGDIRHACIARPARDSV